MNKIFVILTVLIFPFTVYAQQSDSARMASEIKKIMQLRGNWVGDVEMKWMGKTDNFKVYQKNESVAANSGLLVNEHANSNLFGKYASASLVAFNSQTEMVHWFIISNAGEAGETTGNWKDNKLELKEDVLSGEEVEVFSTTTITFVNSNEYIYEYAMNSGGEITMHIKGTFRRGGAAPPGE